MSVLTKKVEVDAVCEMTCDRCGFSTDDAMYIQEFARFGDTGGYASEGWGDMTTWSVDLCSKCSYALFHVFAQIEGE